MENENPSNAKNEIILYKTEDGAIKVDVLFEGETVWLSQAQMAELFSNSSQNITIHIGNIYQEGELEQRATCKDFLQVRQEGSRTVQRKITYYNLDVIISVGYRVKSVRGTQFRQWATKRLTDYIVKGFALNDERFKSGSSMNYFKELLDRIREIRLSERVFYQQIKDIYATSIDYDSSAEKTQHFFKEIQNKLLWAVSGKTAAELVYYRANATLPQMGLNSTSKQGKVLKQDIGIGKNYLQEDELAMLKVIVEQYLAFAEAQALAHKPMYMHDWIERLGLILTINDKNILTHAGKISHELALEKVEDEYAKYKDQEKLAEKVASIKELDEDIKRLTQTKRDKSKEDKNAR